MLRRLLLPLRVLGGSVRRRGVRDTWGRVVRSLRSREAARRRRQADRAFDAARNVETAAWVRTADLVTDSPNRRYSVRYQPSSVEEFSDLLERVDVDHSEYVFVDYGCGKGRALVLAAEYPFKRIVGVDFSPPLVEVARENAESLGPDAARVEAVAMDAADFEPPPEPLVVYFFNPFELPVLKPVLARLRASLERHPRPAYVVVTGPPELGRAVEQAGFEPRDVDRLGWVTRGVFARVPLHVAQWAAVVAAQSAA